MKAKSAATAAILGDASASAKPPNTQREFEALTAKFAELQAALAAVGIDAAAAAAQTVNTTAKAPAVRPNTSITGTSTTSAAISAASPAATSASASAAGSALCSAPASAPASGVMIPGAFGTAEERGPPALQRTKSSGSFKKKKQPPLVVMAEADNLVPDEPVMRTHRQGQRCLPAPQALPPYAS